MRTHRSSDAGTCRLRVLAALISFACAVPLHASFHLMQIEQVIGGVNGDTTAQAVQLRMRMFGENFVSGGTLIAVDAAGNNPITLVTFSSNVTNNTAGTRILITTASFASHETSPISPDFTMTNAIPASYLAAGRLTYQHPPYQNGAALWSVSWGGAGYTGPNTGTLDNDADGNFAPPFAGVLPSDSTVALQFTGPASAMSTNNAADYALTPGAATFTNNAGDSTSLIAGTPTPTPTPTPAQALNISTRMQVQTGNNVLIGGFIVTGNAPKNVVVRGIGPSLTQFGITDALADPTLELHDATGSLIFQDDDWQDDPAQAAQLTALALAPSNPKESAIVATLQPASYTAILAGKNQTTGVGLVEVYDTNPAANSQLGNISTRGFVLTGNNAMIGGFILGGNSNTRVVVRGIGPSLAQFGISPVLADPTLELHDSNGATLVSNNDWQDDPASASQITALGLAPSDPKESAIFMSLPPGGFTAILAGNDGGTGIGLVEVYNVH